MELHLIKFNVTWLWYLAFYQSIAEVSLVLEYV